MLNKLGCTWAWIDLFSNNFWIVNNMLFCQLKEWEHMQIIHYCLQGLFLNQIKPIFGNFVLLWLQSHSILGVKIVVNCYLASLKVDYKNTKTKKENKSKKRNNGEREKKLATIGINKRPVTYVVTNHIILFIQYLKTIIIFISLNCAANIHGPCFRRFTRSS